MRQEKHIAYAVVCIIAVLICGCGKKDEGGSQPPAPGPAGGQSSQSSVQQTPAQPPASAQPAPAAGETGGVPTAAQLSEIAAKNRETLTQMNQGKEIAAVTTDTLKGLLPETLAGMKRTSASAERNQAMGMDMTHAEGQYQGDNDTSLDLRITDIGNMSGAMRMGMVGWTMAQYNRETDTGYEKTGTYSGYKGLEEYDKENKSGTIRVFVADRFVVEINGSNITMDDLKKALEQVDLKKAASLASGS
ncbi:MAG: hypothetical protein ABFD90_19525 [Phycisphaerales bacterium]